MLDTSNMWPPLIWAVVALAVFNIVVSVSVLSDDGSTPLQKGAQLLIVWVMPVVGGMFVRSLIARPRPVGRDPGFTEPSCNPPGLGGNDPMSQ
jgi:hypothetical protein